jgi:hypothetical protein
MSKPVSAAAVRAYLRTVARREALRRAALESALRRAARLQGVWP